MKMISFPFDIVLGSGSPRRKELLAALRVPFRVEVRPVAENFDPSMEPVLVPLYLAETKAAAFSEDSGNALIITADTIVHKDHKILNKPADRAEAIQMLEMLSGTFHDVTTGVCLAQGERKTSFTETTRVYVKEMEKSWMEFYVKEFSPYDKAGGYGIQDWFGMAFISRIEGCYYNVMGLPVSRVFGELCTW